MGFKVVGDQIRALQKSIGLEPHTLAYRLNDTEYRHTNPEELAELANTHIDAFPFTPAKFKLFLARAAWMSNGFREAYVRTGDEYPPATFGQVVGEEEYRDFGVWLFDNQLVDDGEIFVNNPARIRDFEYVWLGLYWRCSSDGWFDKRARVSEDDFLDPEHSGNIQRSLLLAAAGRIVDQDGTSLTGQESDDVAVSPDSPPARALTPDPEMAADPVVVEPALPEDQADDDQAGA